MFLVLPALLMLAACAPAATPMAPHATAAVMATQAPAATQVAAEPGAAGQAPAASQMIIKDATLVLTVRDVDQALTLVTALSADNGGYLIRTETWVEDEAKFAALNMAVPSARFEATLNQLRRLALKVEHKTSSGQDVTAEYTDLRSQLTNLEATAARVRAFLDDAKTVEESLRINAELSRLEGDIERITGQMRYYEGRSAFSTINLSLQPEPALPAAPPGWDPARTVERATRVAVSLGQGAVDAAIWLTFIAGPPVLVALVLFVALRVVMRRRGSRAEVD
jgi:hypothetical protein